MTTVAASNAESIKPRGLRRVVAATLVAGVALFSSAAMAQRANVEKEFPLPAEIAEMKKGTTADFESKKAGMGYSFAYGKAGVGAVIYIYDAGVKNIPEGSKNDVITAQLERSKQEVYSVQKAGVYSNVQLKSTFDVNDSGGKPTFSCAAFQMNAKGGSAVDSYVCMTGAAKKFVKVRFTQRQDANSKAAVEKFLGELSGILPAR